MATTLDGHQVRDPHDLHAKIEVQLDQAAEEVARRFPDNTDYESVRRAVGDAYERLSRDAKFQNFLPILAARAAAQTLAEETIDNQSN